MDIELTPSDVSSIKYALLSTLKVPPVAINTF